VARGGPLVAILWGRDAQSLIPMLGSVPYVASAHPSPLSATAGFYGSRPFSRANELLVRAGGEPVNWALESASPDFATRATGNGSYAPTMQRS
jgi:uracil-DNA glycosylase